MNYFHCKGHLILSILDRYGEEKINNILLNICSPQVFYKIIVIEYVKFYIMISSDGDLVFIKIL